jgi:hypothetical protein
MNDHLPQAVSAPASESNGTNLFWRVLQEQPLGLRLPKGLKISYGAEFNFGFEKELVEHYERGRKVLLDFNSTKEELPELLFIL